MTKRPRPTHGRDRMMVHIINGVTKAGIHLDKKKERDKYGCRESVDEQNSEHAGLPTEGGGCYPYVGPQVEDTECSGSGTS